MADRPIRYTARADATPDREADALARVYAFITEQDDERERKGRTRQRAPQAQNPQSPGGYRNATGRQ